MRSTRVKRDTFGHITTDGDIFFLKAISTSFISKMFEKRRKQFKSCWENIYAYSDFLCIVAFQ